MRLLALDSSTASCSVALWDDQKGGDDRKQENSTPIVAHCCKPMERGQSEALIPMVEAVMGEAGWAFGDLDRLGVTVGPGSFTGVRIGLAAARGLALAGGGLPLVGVTSLEAIALEARARGGDGDITPPHPLLVALSAGRSDLYVQMFSRNQDGDSMFPWQPVWSPLEPPGSAMPEEIPGRLPQKGTVLIAGNGAPLIRNILAAEGAAGSGRQIVYGDGPGLPDAAAVAALAASRDAGTSESEPAPLYIHSHYARLPQDGVKEETV